MKTQMETSQVCSWAPGGEDQEELGKAAGPLDSTGSFSGLPWGPGRVCRGVGAGNREGERGSC